MDNEFAGNTMDARLDNDALIYYQQSVLDDIQEHLIFEIDKTPFTEDCRKAIKMLVQEQFSREYVVNNYDKFDVFRMFLTMREKITTLQAQTRPVNHSGLLFIMSLIEGHGSNKFLRSSDKGFERRNQQAVYTHQAVEDRTPLQERSGLGALWGRR